MEVGGEVDVQTHEEEATNLHEQEGEEHLPYYANERVQLPDQLEHGMQEQEEEENQQEGDKEEDLLEYEERLKNFLKQEEQGRIANNASIPTDSHIPVNKRKARGGIIINPPLSKYELIRAHNIASRDALFHAMGIQNDVDALRSFITKRNRNSFHHPSHKSTATVIGRPSLPRLAKGNVAYTDWILAILLLQYILRGNVLYIRPIINIFW